MPEEDVGLGSVGARRRTSVLSSMPAMTTSAQGGEKIVPWVTYGTLLRSEIPTGADLSLAEGVRLQSLPDWLHSADVLKYVSERTRESLREFKSALAVEYQADSLGMPDPTWGNDEEGRPRSVQAHA